MTTAAVLMFDGGARPPDNGEAAIGFTLQIEGEPRREFAGINGSERCFPDFVTDRFIIEVKGHLRADGNEVEKAEVSLEQYTYKEYVVIGAQLPCNHHYTFDDRHKLRGLFDVEINNNRRDET